MSADPRVFWTIRDQAETVAALPARGPLPCRTVLVPSEPAAHALRREVIRGGHAAALAGTRFIPVTAAAIQVLHAAGVEFTAGEEARRRFRLLTLLRGSLPLRHFPVRLLRDKPGWDHAFARAVADLEAAGLSPDHLDAARDDRLADVATVWRALDEAAGRSWTAARILREAAAVLEREPGAWPFFGPVLVTLTGHESAVEGRFLRAIPGATVGLLAARPLRERHLERLEALYGAAVRRAAPARPAPPGAEASERDLLAAYLFEAPAVLSDPARPRSRGPDGTVRLEEHAGVEAELEATADWVAEQVADGVPLEEIAVLVPALDPLAALVAERLARLPWPAGALGASRRPDGGTSAGRAAAPPVDRPDEAPPADPPGPDPALPVHVAGGLPLAGTAAGARALAVVRALRAHLAGDALAAVLPALRTAGADAGRGDGPPDGAPPGDAREPARHLSHGAALDLVWSLGTAGGNPARPEGALEWADRLAAREPQLQAQLERAREGGDDPEKSGLARTARDLERLLADLRAARPAIEALVRIAALALSNAPLAALWPALRDFLAEWLLQPGPGARVHALLDEALAPLAGDGACGALRGDEALQVVEAAIETSRRPAGRFGEPAVYVGTVASAAGLAFTAVRVIGLAEGHLPPLGHEDPVVPDTLRAALGAGGLAPPTAADRALAALHALDLAVRGAGRRVALSVPRLDLHRTQREPSSVILEAAAALGRPNAATGEPQTGIPDATALRRDAFAPARRAALALRHGLPLLESAWHDAVAHGAVTPPARWHASPALDLDRLARLPDDGLLGRAAADIVMPGLTPERPISASALQALLRCPYLYLLGWLLGLDEPGAAPSLREIGQPSYGSLFHAAAEAVFREHGPAFCAGEGSLVRWLAAADPIVDRVFDAFLEQYPLVGEAVRGAQRERLRADVRALLGYEWGLGARRFVAAERSFGEPVPVELRLPGRSLYVRGTMDRVDADGRRTIVRDLKTGRVPLRLGDDAAPDPVADLQIALYGLVAEQLAGAWGTPARVGVGYVGRHGEERAFLDDFATVLAPAAREWLALAADLLAARAFPRTPQKDDCEYCRFRPVCGEGVYERAREVLAGGDAVLARLRALKTRDEDD